MIGFGWLGNSMDIFYYWETRGGAAMPDYLHLCMETWRANVPDANVLRVDQANLSELSGGLVDVNRLKVFSFPLQSDVAAAAVLSERPGLFLDVDTIILPGVDFAALGSASLVMFGDPSRVKGWHPTNFFHAREAGNPFLLAWLDEANQRISKQTTPLKLLQWALRQRFIGKPAGVRWNYLGNDIVDPLLRDETVADAVEIRDAVVQGYNQPGPTENSVEDYLSLWFGEKNNAERIIPAARDKVAALQNSWTPDWYSKLTSDEIMTDDHAISEVIRFALGTAR